MAFYVIFTNRTQVPGGSTLVFDTIVTNHGSAYDNQDGTFKVKFAGTYQFTLFFHTQGVCDSKLAIIRDSDPEVICYTDGDRWDMASCSAIVDLDFGEIIQVKVMNDPDKNAACIDGRNRGITGFLGHIL